jgi:hypothetical protein
MTRNIAICSLLIVGGVLVTIVAARPSWLSDKNDFLSDLSGRDILPILGVILAITWHRRHNYILNLTK